MGLLKRAFSNERKQFQRLSKQGQKFALSIFLYNIIHPIFAIFINAFLWRQTEDVMIVALFNLSLFCMLPVGFYINGQLLKHFSVKNLYFAGAVFRSSLIALLIFYPAVTQFAVIFFGLGYGLSSGIFFSNKNLLTVELTKSSNRMYFSSLDFLSQTVNNIFIPMALGALLVLGSNNGLYSAQQGYYIVAILMISLSFYMGSAIKKIDIKTPTVANIVLQNGSHQWNCARGITALLGLLTGISMFLPAIIVLSYVGKEDTLGLMQSVAAIISGIIMYTIARSINTKYRVGMITVSIMSLFIASATLAFSFNATGIFLFIAIMTIAQQILFAETNSVILDLIDRENTDQDNKYMYIFDLEMVLNVGRVTSIMFFVFYTKNFSPDFAMQYTPLFFSVALIAIIILAKTIEVRAEVPLRHTELAESYVTKQSTINKY
ncbi:MAG: hypothetical protein H0W89_06880 [Candidatus Levybacteria bacterium]|nr:hypothetical protein [Candidatus Levybacteria bacterium]